MISTHLLKKYCWQNLKLSSYQQLRLLRAWEDKIQNLVTAAQPLISDCWRGKSLRRRCTRQQLFRIDVEHIEEVTHSTSWLLWVTAQLIFGSCTIMEFLSAADHPGIMKCRWRLILYSDRARCAHGIRCTWPAFCKNICYAHDEAGIPCNENSTLRLTLWIYTPQFATTETVTDNFAGGKYHIYTIMFYVARGLPTINFRSLRFFVQECGAGEKIERLLHRLQLRISIWSPARDYYSEGSGSGSD